LKTKNCLPGRIEKFLIHRIIYTPHKTLMINSHQLINLNTKLIIKAIQNPFKLRIKYKSHFIHNMAWYLSIVMPVQFLLQYMLWYHCLHLLKQLSLWHPQNFPTQGKQ